MIVPIPAPVEVNVRVEWAQVWVDVWTVGIGSLDVVVRIEVWTVGIGLMDVVGNGPVSEEPMLRAIVEDARRTRERGVVNFILH